MEEESTQKKLIGLGTPENRVISSELIGKGDWVAINEVKYKYTNPETKEEKLKTWEVIERTTVPKGEEIAGAQMIPILIDKDRRHLLTIKNYRAPVDRFVLEFPGGLLDKGETVEESAMRELKEETGYTAQRIYKSFIPFASYGTPWFSSENAQTFILEVDVNHEDNKDLSKNLDPGEIIENVIIEDIDNCEDLHKEIVRVIEENGVALSSDVMNFVNGFMVAKSLSSSNNNKG